MRQRCAQGLTDLARDRYRPFLGRCLRANLVVSALFLVALFFSLALYGGGWLRAAFFPSIGSDYVISEIQLAEGGAYADTLALLRRVEGRPPWRSRPSTTPCRR